VVGMLGCITVVIVSILIGGKSDLMARQLIENQQKYKLIISASNTGAWEHHADSHVDWHSAEYFKMLGYEEDEFKNNLNIADVWINLLHPDDRDEAIRKFDQYLKNESAELYENYFRMKHKSGRWIWIWSRGQTLRKPDGTKTPVTVGTHIDVTERKNLEIALLKLNETLFNYAYLNAHKVRGPLARLLGLIEISRLDAELDYKWCFEQIGIEATEVDKVLKRSRMS
jgi:PAS domain S-box-containing protein